MSLWNGILRLLPVVFCAAVVAVCAENTTASGNPDASATPQILVLKSGRVVRGTIEPRGNGYDVREPNGLLFVASEQVWLLANSLPEAYETMRNSFSTLTPDVHMRIASWCARNKLFATARNELLDALHKDPYREETRRMLASIIRLQNSAISLSSSPETTAAADLVSTGVVLPRKSLGGLSSELARQFTRQIQPLLSRKCSGCHNARSNRPFVIESIRNGSNPAIASRNLDAVLSQVDTVSPSGDSFLKFAMMRHGEMKSKPFAGRAGAVHRDRLTSWVKRVRREKGFSSVQSPSRNSSTGSDFRVPHARDRAARQFDSAGKSAEIVIRDSNPHVLNRSAKETEKEMLADAGRRNRNDKFNPDIFNRLYRIRPESIDAESGTAGRRVP